MRKIKSHYEGHTVKITEVETLRPAIQGNLLFVLLRTDEGLVGLGESFFGPETVEAYIHETAGPAILAIDNVSPEKVGLALRPYVGFQGAGAETRGNSAIELAVWDLLGKTTGQPLVDLLGGRVRDELRIYNTCAGPGYVRAPSGQSSHNWGLREAGSKHSDYEDLERFLTAPGDLARELRGQGITGMKVWPFDRAAERSWGTEISNRDLDKGLQIVGDIRDAVGRDMDVMIEMHGLWQRPAATRILRHLVQFDPYWVEDPLRPDSVNALRTLRDAVDIPIATGETCVGRQGFASLLSEGIIDYATVDVQWSGGLTEARKIASLADAYGVPIAPHDCTGPATLAASAHLATSQPNGFIQETARAFLHTWYQELVVGLPQIEAGVLRLSSAPGHGVAIRDEVFDSPGISRRITLP